MINLIHGPDRITIDLRCRQIRYLKDFVDQGEIVFHELSNDDVAGYQYLWKEDKELFLTTLKSDLKEFHNIDINCNHIMEFQ